MSEPSLRVAFIAGSLGQGGAEKQLLYLARELARAHVDVHVLTLTHGEIYEPLFAEAGLPVTWAGRYRLPRRIVDLALRVRRLHPHVIHAGHFFTNLYAAAAARVSGCAEIGAIRNDTQFDVAECGRWGPALLRLPRTLIANSEAAARNAQAAGVDASRLHVLTNVIDLAAFDRDAFGREAFEHAAFDRPTFDRRAFEHAPVGTHVDAHANGDAVAIAVARLVPAKRLDRFLHALVQARRAGAHVRGVIVGDGPERAALEARARELDLYPDGIEFLGARSDVPQLLVRADMLVLTSQHEGFPNVLLEAMAARLPVVSTPAGDAAELVQDGQTGFLVPFDDEALLTTRLMQLARSRETRHALGSAGRRLVEARYGVDTLARRALHIYGCAARQQHSVKTRQAVEALAR